MPTDKMTRSDLEVLKKRVGEDRVLGQRGRQARITVHMGTCGLASGAQKVLDALKEKVSKSKSNGVVVTTSGCIGLCSQEPLVTVECQDMEPVVYAQVDAESIGRIFDKHVKKGEVEKDLALMRGLALWEEQTGRVKKDGGVQHVSEFPFFAMQRSWVLHNRGLIDPQKIEDYIWRDGYQAAAKALFEMEPKEIISEIKISGLRGRGGGGFPTGLKWEFCAASKGDEKYVLCNADEGDPGAFMDRSVMEGDPHAVLEGMIIAARAIGAHRGYVYCRAEYPLAVETLGNAIEQARGRGLLGKDILGSGFDFDLEIYQGAGAFVCGEETALMTSIEGLRGTPRPRPPFPAVSGLWQKPTILNNVETYANISQIILRGGEEYANLGTESSKGTKVFALTGKVNNIGLVEVPMGTPLGRIIYDIGGGIPDGKKFKAAQLGGPSGGCLPVEHLNTPTEYEAITQAGAIMGSGGLIVMDEDTCMVDMARYFMDFCQDESCGKCTPCRVGTRRMLQILERICEGQGREGDIELLEDLAQSIKDAALCGLGQTAPNPVLSTIRYFRDEYEAHIRDKRCPASVCSALFKSPCQHTCPVGMDIPAYVALVRANRIDDAYKVLKRTNPFPAVCGRVCSHPCQAKCRRGQLDEPVAIRHIKRFVTDHAERPLVRKLPVTREERVAVVGAGPSGLTAALELKKRGYAVTVFEGMSEPGGMLRWGIPEYRLPRDVLREEIQDILDTGVELHTNSKIGRDVTFKKLLEGHEAVYVAVGAQKSMRLNIEGEEIRGVHGAVELLRKINQGDKVKIGKRVVVIGGGNSAVDAARTAMRLGALKVIIAYRRERKDMPALPEEIEAALQEGIELKELVAPVRILEQDGRVSGIELCRMELGEFDRSGRKKPKAIEGKQLKVKADTVISAVSQEAELEFLEKCDVRTDGSRIRVDRLQGTDNPRIFAGGDVVTGPAMVIDAIRAGQEAARSIDEFLRAEKGESAWVPPPEEEIEIPPAVEEEAVECPQTPMPELSARTRRRDFREVEKGYTRKMALSEACRCLRCDTEAD